jgi:dTDP-4-amino-4,6-dideoxygalactose transaminase
MVTTNNPALAEQVRLLRNHGQAQRYFQTAIGYNQRMTDLQAALGLTQLSQLERFTEQRIANARFLTQGLSGTVKTPITRLGYRHVYHQYTIEVPDERDAWAAQLQRRGIGTGIHYPLPVYAQPFYRVSTSQFRLVHSAGRDVGAAPTSLPVTEAASRKVLSLPIHPALSENDLATIVREVRALCQ